MSATRTGQDGTKCLGKKRARAANPFFARLNIQPFIRLGDLWF